MRFSFIVASLALLTVAAAQNLPPAKSGRNPCHANRREQGDGQKSCLHYVIPRNLCVACKYRRYSKTGYFKNCGKFFWIGGWCASQLRLYAKLNPCDKLRNKQVQNLRNPFNVMGLDYFVYSICEMCCDCVPMGSKRSDFTSLQQKGGLMKVDRANCPAHAVADICKVWPNVRKVYSQKEARILQRSKKMPTQKQLMAMPKVCDGMRKWKKTAGQLYRVREVKITEDMRDFMTTFVDAATCRDRRPWNRCVDLERSQNRLQ